MKWLYRILRLFFCPHKFNIVKTIALNRIVTKTKIGECYIQKCNYCGKIESYEILV